MGHNSTHQCGASKISSFHIIGEIFDKVYPKAALNTVYKSVQTTLIPSGNATVVELKLESSGTFALLDRAISRIDRAVFGVFQLEGEHDLNLLRLKSTQLLLVDCMVTISWV